MEAFIRAIRQYNIVKVERLIDHPNVDINRAVIGKRHQLLTPLSEAVNNDHYNIVKLLLENGAKVDLHKLSRPILISAIINENNDITELLLEYGADVNVSDEISATPLYYAILYNNIKIVKLLLEHGANVSVADYLGNSPLKTALIKNLIDIAKELIKYGADIPIFDDDECQRLSQQAKDLIADCFEIKEPC